MSLLVMAPHAKANSLIPNSNPMADCSPSTPFQANQFTCTRGALPNHAVAINIPVNASPELPEEAVQTEYPMLEFSARESDAAVALYGCDCPACMNALRRLRNLPPVVNDGRDDCWTVQQRIFKADPEDVIAALEQAEAENSEFAMN